MRHVIALVCLLACLGLVAAKDEIKIEGSVCCAKCELGKEKACKTVVVVKENNKEVIYYFDAESDKKFHKDYCKGSVVAKVTAKVTEKDGKKWLSVEKIEKKS